MLELLVVIAIIGILAALLLNIFGDVRRQARDDRRVADLRQAEQALRLFHLKCGFYPGKFDSTNQACLGGQENGSQASQNPNNWDDLGINLKNAEIGAGLIPYDPLAGRTYEYRVQLSSSGPPPTPRAQCYVLKAQMETTHRSLDDPKELDSVSLVNFYPDTPNCTDPNYCIGNAECFYGG